ncbi:MAG: hypothetical protein WC760_06305 [Bacteroidia bacterium]|jgi:hypothetical protein
MNQKKAKKLRKLAAAEIENINWKDSHRNAKVKRFYPVGAMLPEGKLATTPTYREVDTEVRVNKLNVAKKYIKSLINQGKVKL